MSKEKLLKSIVSLMLLFMITPQLFASGAGSGSGTESLLECTNGFKTLINSDYSLNNICKFKESYFNVLSITGLYGNATLTRAMHYFLYSSMEFKEGKNVREYCESLDGIVKTITIEDTNQEIEVCSFQEEFFESFVDLVTLYKGAETLKELKKKFNVKSQYEDLIKIELFGVSNGFMGAPYIQRSLPLDLCQNIEKNFNTKPEWKSCRVQTNFDEPSNNQETINKLLQINNVKCVQNSHKENVLMLIDQKQNKIPLILHSRDLVGLKTLPSETFSKFFYDFTFIYQTYMMDGIWDSIWFDCRENLN